MQAFKFGEAISLIFTKVLDEIQRGLVDDDEAVQSAPANREFWEKKGSRDTVLLADELFAICKSIDATLELKYNTPYISLRKDGSPFNFVYFRPRKNSLYFQVKLPKSDDIDSMISQAGIEQIGYEPRDGYYNLSLSRADVRERQNVLKQLITAAYQYRVG
jgi:predicted transport protein